MNSNILPMRRVSKPPVRTPDLTLELWDGKDGVQWVSAAPGIETAEEHCKTLRQIEEALWVVGCSWFEDGDPRAVNAPDWGIFTCGEWINYRHRGDLFKDARRIALALWWLGQWVRASRWFLRMAWRATRGKG